MNDKTKFAVQILKEYTEETGNTVRSTTDLSPLEEWLILRLSSVKCGYKPLKKGTDTAAWDILQILLK